MCSPISKNVAGACSRASSLTKSAVGGSYHGPSSNVSAMSWTLRGPVNTQSRPVGTQPTRRGMWSASNAGVAGNNVEHVVLPGAAGGVQPLTLTLLITCQRSGRYWSPTLEGRKLAVSSRSLDRVRVASIATAGPGPARVIGEYSSRGERSPRPGPDRHTSEATDPPGVRSISRHSTARRGVVPRERKAGRPRPATRDPARPESGTRRVSPAAAKARWWRPQPPRRRPTRPP